MAVNRDPKRLFLYSGPQDGTPSRGTALTIGLLLAVMGAVLALGALAIAKGFWRGRIPAWIPAVYSVLFLALGATLAARGLRDLLRRGSSPAPSVAQECREAGLLRGVLELLGFGAFILPASYLGWEAPGMKGLFAVSLIFTGFWLFGAWRFSRQLRARLLLGRARLRWLGAPFSPGGSVGGEFSFPKPPRRPLNLVFTLRRVEPISERTPDGSRQRVFLQTYADTLELGAEAVLGSDGVLPLRFPLPADLPADSPEGPWHWELHVLGKGSGLRYEAAFPVPILDSGQAPAAE